MACQPSKHADKQHPFAGSLLEMPRFILNCRPAHRKWRGMKLADVANHIGAKVHLNGRYDLAMDGLCRPYIWPRSDVPFVFTIIKVTRGGLVHIQCDSDKKFLTVRAINVDLVE